MKKRIIIRRKGGVIKRQEGGAMPQEQAAQQAPQQETGGNPLEEMMTQYAQDRSPEVAVMIADMLLEQFMQQQQTEAAPAPEGVEGDPMGRYGMSLKKLKR